jgi:hypothetical protein
LDGSGQDHAIGATALQVINEITINSLHYYLGTDTEQTVYEAETLAVILAIHMLINSKCRMAKVMIGLDNQAVLYALLNQRSKPSHHLIDRIHDSLEDFQVT